MKTFEPLTFKKMTIANRIGVAPMCTYMCKKKDGVAEDFHLAHYTTFALGQPGFIIQEATAVNENGYISDYDLGIYHPRQREALKHIVESVHAHNVKMGVQLAHAGAKSKRSNVRIVAPSAVDGAEEMSVQDIEKVIFDFEAAAKWARIIGYDFVEVHGAHGYLINQFLSPLTNHRTDEYGEDKQLLLKKVVTVVLKEFDGPVFVRLSGTEYHEDGRTIEDTQETVKMLAKMGVSVINMSSGGVVAANIPLGPKYQVPLATAAKQVCSIPVATAGLITEREHIRSIIDNEEADLVLLGRLALRDPFFILKWKYEENLLSKEDVPNYMYRSLQAMK